MRLTKPGPTDLHWMCVIIGATSASSDTAITFFETDLEARTYAKLSAPERGSVYISKIEWQGENVARRKTKESP